MSTFRNLFFQNSAKASTKSHLRLFAQPGIEDTLRFEQRHKDIIVRFGRSPYSNALLGRDSTPEELAFLSESGSGFNPLSMSSDSPMHYNMDLIAT